MKILIVAVHFEVTGARYITDAFKRLGHDVKHIGAPARLKDAWGVDVPEKYIWTPDVVERDWADLVIIADSLSTGYYTNIEDNIPHIIFGMDNHVRNYRDNFIAHYFLAHKHGQAQPVSHDDETWLPCASDNSVFTPSPIAWDDRKYDVAMVGVMYPNRVEVLDALKAAGLKVYASTGDVYDEYRAIYQNSRISLCLSANDDLAQRVFETGAMGCLIAMDIPADVRDKEAAIALGITGYIQLNSAAQAVKQITEMLTTEKALAKFGAESWQKVVLERHDWTHRAQVVVDWYNANYRNGQTMHTVSEVNQHADAVELTQKSKSTGYYPADVMANIEGGITLDLLPQRHVEATLTDKFNQPIMHHIVKADGKSYYEDAMGNVLKPYLNLGCGKTHLPGAVPAGHDAVDKAIYDYPLWVNVDKVDGVGADKVFNLFSYPWPLEDNSYDGALCAHILEHIPYEIKIGESWIDDSVKNLPENPTIFQAMSEPVLNRVGRLKRLQDGWYAFFSELYRVLTPGALVHIVSPYGWSDGGITDPTHRRLLTINTFTHSMTPEISDGSTFKYNNGDINFVIDGDVMYRFTPMAELLRQRTGFDYPMLMNVYNNICYDFYLRLRVVK